LSNGFNVPWVGKCKLLQPTQSSSMQAATKKTAYVWHLWPGYPGLDYAVKLHAFSQKSLLNLQEAIHRPGDKRKLWLATGVGATIWQAGRHWWKQRRHPCKQQSHNCAQLFGFHFLQIGNCMLSVPRAIRCTKKNHATLPVQVVLMHGGSNSGAPPQHMI